MIPTRSAERPLYYDSARTRFAALDELRESLRYRDLILQMVRRDIVTRYKRSVLGVAWSMLNPLGMMLVLTVAFSQLFSSVRSYPVFVLTGIVAWNFFAQTSVLAMKQFQWGGTLLHRIYVPRTVFALSAAGTGLVNLLLSLFPIVLAMLILDVPFRPSLLFLPVSILILAAFALGMGLLLSTLAAYFWDVSEIYEIAILAWMYLTPVIYPENIIPERIRVWLVLFNPMYSILRTFRMPIYDGVLPDPMTIITAAGISIATLLAGWVLFTVRADEYAYRI